MRYKLLGVLVALGVAGCAVAISYFTLNHIYGTSHITVLPMGEYFGWALQDGLENRQLQALKKLAVPLEEYIAPSVATTEMDALQIAQEKAAGAGTQLIVFKTEPIAVLPISASIGAAMGVMVFAVWIGYRRMWGDATLTLLEHGLHDMTVRDVEIVGHIMEMKEFTIPELMRRTRASKITVWRTVQKLVGQGLVQPTGQTKLAANGLGGRGKPSHVYKYVGLRESV